MIENPPVNPITGAHRSSSDVRSELRQHQEQLRNTSTSTTPIFLSDYLFFTVRGKGVKLGRVSATPPGGALKASDVVDIVEYAHQPQQGVSGFFGTFKPLENTDYNPKLKGSTKMVKHRDVNREDIVICNVCMTGRSAEDLRVSLKSLRQLADAMPDAHSLPKKLPSTHSAQRDEPQQRPARELLAAGPLVAHIGRPLANPGDRIEVYWEEDPQGWFSGKVTSSRREDDKWITRIEYEACEEWGRTHSAWHVLDPSHDDHVTWRFAK